MHPFHLGQAAAAPAAGRAARVLRRRGPRDRHRRAGAATLWRTGLCPARDRPQPLCGGHLKAKGAVFVEELDKVPQRCPGGVQRARGAQGGPCRRDAARARPARCQPARWSARSTARPNARSRPGGISCSSATTAIPEVIGTMGQVPEGAITLVETVADVAALDFADQTPLAFLTQTTLSVDDTAEVVAALRARYPRSSGPRPRTSVMPRPTARPRSRPWRAMPSWCW